MIDDLIEALQTNATLSNVSVKQPDTNHNIWQLAELSNLLWCGQTDEWPQTCSRQNAFQGSSDFPLNGIWNGRGQLNGGVVAYDVLLVLVKQVVKDLLVKQSDSLEVVTTAWFEAHNLINQAVWLVREICDVLLALHFLTHVGWVISYLQLYRVYC